MWCRTGSMLTRFFPLFSFSFFFQATQRTGGLLTNPSPMNGGVMTQQMWQSGTVLPLNESHDTLTHSFPGISELCWWL